jgi:hypothetical protein
VDGTGSIHTSPRDSPEGRAICGGLGLIGVITELTIGMWPVTHLHVVGTHDVNDDELAGDIRKIIKVQSCARDMKWSFLKQQQQQQYQ